MAESARLPIQTARAAAAAAITHWCALADQIAIAPNATVITLNSAASGMARCYSSLNSSLNREPCCAHPTREPTYV